MISVPSEGTIALVDDDDLDRMIIERVLKMSDLDNPIIHFRSGAAFIEHVADLGGEEALHELALVLLDINMPGMTGFEALSHIRTEMGLLDLPIVVMLTSSDASGDMRKAIELGAQAYLAKQSGLDKFVAVINETFTNDLAV